MNNLSIFCADIGSIKKKKFGWASFIEGKFDSDICIDKFAASIATEIKNKRKVALGFECPLFVPVRHDPINVNSARDGEKDRSWSASAGACALTTGLVEVLWTIAYSGRKRPPFRFEKGHRSGAKAATIPA